MTKDRYLKNLSSPLGFIDAVIDTDAFNEIDDQFAISLMLLSGDKINTKAIYAAPFLNTKSDSPSDGMEKSYREILRLLSLMNMGYMKSNVFKGSRRYLPDEKTPVESDAAKHLSDLAMKYSPENPLYVIAIGAITNVASALLLRPEIAENIVIVWLGGHSFEYDSTEEFNMIQDIPAARVVLSSAAPTVTLPCNGVVSQFSVSGAELEKWLLKTTPIANYLAENAIREAEHYAKGRPWSRVIWDVTAVAWLLNDNDRYMLSRVCNVRLPLKNGKYESEPIKKKMRYVYFIKRDQLVYDLFKKLRNEA